MDGLNDVTVSVLNAANIDEVLIHTLSRDDLRDLFPGPENFLRRKQLWAHLHKEEDYSTLPDKAGPGEAGTRSSPKQTPPTKILEAYPCFKELHNVMDELQRILDKNNKFITEVKARWEDFCSVVQFYGLWKKVLKPPMNQNRVEYNIALFRALPTLFPSPTAPPKKLGHASEALLHVLQPAEDPAIYLQRRSLFSPVLLFDGSHCIMAIGTTPITTFAKEDLCQGLLYLMAYYYTLHLTYPKCVATLLSVIQTEVLKDSIHERDTTSSYKKAMAEWKAFIQE
ncbi:uncharacterized protein LOC115791134 [Archocentrus centrarchus]|uniref:uncharacterized protein LOC115791134 n=1 Tax=Archocentrus centrarchus TaxID=63155 RepID=UPI0011EA49A7|nr:uncharacterized protein LOC115791134 [Archocentrus centrarchus]XP_030601118.1 uncharacterized protein LOC115791134 [Archocentrus centrarchus]